MWPSSTGSCSAGSVRLKCASNPTLFAMMRDFDTTSRAHDPINPTKADSLTGQLRRYCFSFHKHSGDRRLKGASSISNDASNVRSTSSRCRIPFETQGIDGERMKLIYTWAFSQTVSLRRLQAMKSAAPYASSFFASLLVAAAFFLA